MLNSSVSTHWAIRSSVENGLGPVGEIFSTLPLARTIELVVAMVTSYWVVVVRLETSPFNRRQNVAEYFREFPREREPSQPIQALHERPLRQIFWIFEVLASHVVRGRNAKRPTA